MQKKTIIDLGDGNVRTKVQTITDTPSRVQQNHRDLVNVNTIVGKYRRTGFLSNVSVRQPMYGDFAAVEDFHDAVNRVQSAINDFGALPSELRKEFGNDPGKLLEFLANADNLEKAVELGLVDAEALPPVVPPPPPVEPPVEP